MGLGYELPTKKSDQDRAASYGAWMTKYNNAQQQSFNSWKSSMNEKDQKSNANNPWGPVFKNKQNFVNMHFC